MNRITLRNRDVIAAVLRGSLAIICPVLWVVPHVAMADAAAPQDVPIVVAVSLALDGKGQILRNTRMVIRDRRIVRIDPRAEPVTYDLRGLTVLPGLIDSHVHIGWHFGPRGDYGETDETPQQAALAIAANARVTLMAGFTTVQSVGSQSDLALREAIAAHTIPGPRILTSGDPLDGSTAGGWSVAQTREFVRERKRRGADLIKILASNGMLDDHAPNLSQEQLNAACDEARRSGLRTLVHAYGAAVRMAALAGCTEVEHGTYATQDDLQLLARRGIYFDPQAGLVMENYIANMGRFPGLERSAADRVSQLQAVIPVMHQQFRRALAVKGLKIVFGSDAVAGAAGRNAEELIDRVRDGGQSAMAAIISATSLAAEAMGLGHEVGSLTPGLQADIIAVDGDPLTDITAVRNVVFVMRGGTVYKSVAHSTILHGPVKVQ
jgi:imidazolonepropionase-like amidohydrolase